MKKKQRRTIGYWRKQKAACGVSAHFFEEFVRSANLSDNREDDLTRAKIMGFGDGVMVAPGAIIRIRSNRIGARTFIGLYCYINGDVRIGSDVLIGPYCALPAGNHLFDPASKAFRLRDEPRPIVIGDGSWLCNGCTVTNGVTIGRGNLICANSVVTHDTVDFAIMAGTPARQIGRIDPETGEYIWFGRETPDAAENSGVDGVPENQPR